MRMNKAYVVIAVAGAMVLAACSSNGGATSGTSGGSQGSASASSPGSSTSGSATSGSATSGSATSGSSSSAPAAQPLPNTGKPIDVMGWTTGDEVGTSRSAYVKKQDPKLDVKVDQNGFDQQKFATAMASGTVPAGVSMDRQLLATYAAKGFLEPLDDCISSDGIDMSQYYPEAVKESTWDGHIYGIPEFYTTREVYVNNRVLKDAGLTADDIDTSDWGSISDLAKKLYQATGGKPRTNGFGP